MVEEKINSLEKILSASEIKYANKTIKELYNKIYNQKDHKTQ
jgi:hypothetical protein